MKYPLFWILPMNESPNIIIKPNLSDLNNYLLNIDNSDDNLNNTNNQSKSISDTANFLLRVLSPENEFIIEFTNYKIMVY